MEIQELEKKEVTRREFQQILADYGHHMNVEVPVNGDHEIEWRCILSNATVYNPYGKYQIGMSNNEANAENAMKFVKKEAGIYSSVFHHTTGYYTIID